MAETILSIVLFIILLGLVLRYGLVLCYGYRIGKDGIEIRALHRLTVWSMPFQDIREIGQARLGSHDIPDDFNNTFSWLRLGNKITKDLVLIRKSRGIRNIIITPDNPSDFVTAVRSHL